MASQITGVSNIHPTVYSGADRRTPKLRVTGLCEENSPVRKFSEERANNSENVSIWWRHHGNKFQCNLNRNLYIFIQENTFENVVGKMAGISSRPQCVNWYQQLHFRKKPLHWQHSACVHPITTPLITFPSLTWPVTLHTLICKKSPTFEFNYFLSCKLAYMQQCTITDYETYMTPRWTSSNSSVIGSHFMNNLRRHSSASRFHNLQTIYRNISHIVQLWLMLTFRGNRLVHV